MLPIFLVLLALVTFTVGDFGGKARRLARAAQIASLCGLLVLLAGATAVAFIA